MLRRLQNQAALAVNGALDLAFPPRCIGCGGVGSYYCPRCQAAAGALYDADGPTLQGVELGLLDGLTATASFDGTLRKAIHALKYDGLRRMAIPLGDRLAETYGRRRWSATLLVPVPMHPQRLEMRGYNHAALLAERLAARTGIACAENVLIRTRDTAQQAHQSAHERQVNVAGAFAADRVQILNKRIIIVDDVCTTGATLRSCATALKEAGAACVWALTVASAQRAPPNHPGDQHEP